MQDPTFTTAAFPQLKAQFPEHEQLRCPRCDSTNTKFCYYNNYNLSQPRHFCKSCRRYWTKGGALRNIPVGGGCRKNSKRSSATKQQSQPQSQLQRGVQNPPAGINLSPDSMSVPNEDQVQSLRTEPTAPTLGSIGVQTGSSTPAGSGVSFTSLLGLASEGHFSNFLEGLGQSGQKIGSGNGSGQVSGLDALQGNGSSTEGYVINGLQHGSEANCWESTNGWSDLAIYAPGSNKLQ